MDVSSREETAEVAGLAPYERVQRTASSGRYSGGGATPVQERTVQHVLEVVGLVPQERVQWFAEQIVEVPFPEDMQEVVDELKIASEELFSERIRELEF